MNIFVFDIETIPDLENARKLYNLQNLSDAEVVQALLALRRQSTNGSEFLPLYMQQIAAISVVLSTPNNFKVWSLGESHSTEKELLQRFFTGLEKHQPTLVTWNGCGFDLPVIHYRSLIHGVQAGRYWDTGEGDSNFKYNNYLNRYHYRHMDLMDILSGYQSRANAPLDTIATMLGFPGKMGMDGSQVWEQYQQGNIESIRNYCETDVLNTYLVYLRFELIRCKLNQDEYQSTLNRVRETLQKSQKPHLLSFLEAWEIQEI